MIIFIFLCRFSRGGRGGGMYYRGRGRGGPPVPMYRMTVSRNVHRYFTRNMQIHAQYNIRKYVNVLKMRVWPYLYIL